MSDGELYAALFLLAVLCSLLAALVIGRWLHENLTEPRAPRRNTDDEETREYWR